MEKKQSRIVIILSGYNQRAIIAFLRTLQKNEVAYAIIARDKNDPILKTNYSEKNVFVRKNKELDLTEIISIIKLIYAKTGFKKSIFSPSTESLNRFLIKNRRSFNDENCIIPLVKKNLYEAISDKYAFGKLCHKNKIQIPKEYTETKNITLPCVAKPIQYLASKSKQVFSPVILFNKKDLKKFKDSFNASEFYFQEFVSGKSFYLLYYFYKNGTFTKFSQENIIQQPEGKSIVTAISSDFHLSKESKKYETLFKNMKFHGLVMVEIKQDGKNNYMIEANPRFWGPSQLFVDSNVNLFEAFLFDYGIINKPSFNYPEKKIKYFWFGGICQTLNAQKELVFHKKNQKNLLLNTQKWIKSDVYKRKDTLYIFKQELVCKK